MERKYYITTAIDYTNGKPHIGHALEKVQADVLARYHRQKGFKTFFLTGTDEHGVKVLKAVKAVEKKPQEFVNELSAEFKALKQALNLSWDDFIRTTDKERHWPGAQLVWKKLVEAGDIYKKNYKGLYCVGCEKFVTQKDLVDGKCKDHQKEPEVVEEENYFFRLSKYSKLIGEKIKSGEFQILPEARANEILSLIDNEGLEDVSFSRPRKDLPWGIPVPGDEEHTMYVWCDALSNYISAIGYGQKEGKEQIAKRFWEWWPAEAQVIGKDILRFHAGVWPGMLISAGLPLPKKLLVHGFVTAEGQKMSKTIGNVLDPFELVKKYGTDPVRYYLLKEIPSHEDGDFSFERFEQVYNGELANGLGNFAARVLTLASGLGVFKADFSDDDSDVAKKIIETKKRVDDRVHAFKLHEAVLAINELISFGDEYVNKNQVWKIADPKQKTRAISDLISILDNVAALLLPFLPETSEKISKNIKWIDKNNLEVQIHRQAQGGKGEVLFPRLKF